MTTTAQVLDAYAQGYRYLANVFFGTLTPSLNPGSPISGVAYRHIRKTKEQVTWEGSVGLSPGRQSYELWSATLAGHTPIVGDVFTDSVALPWQILQVDSEDLVGSTATPATFNVLAQRAK